MWSAAAAVVAAAASAVERAGSRSRDGSRTGVAHSPWAVGAAMDLRWAAWAAWAQRWPYEENGAAASRVADEHGRADEEDPGKRCGRAKAGAPMASVGAQRV